jgi:phosphatidate cytidylyltransferase
MSKAMLVKRILTAAIGIPVLIGLILAGRYFFLALVVAAVVIAMTEYRGLAAKIGGKPNFAVSVGFAAGLPVMYVLGGWQLCVAWLAALVIMLLALKAAERDAMSWRVMVLTAIGVLYIGLSATFLTAVYDLSFGPQLVIYVFIATWLADTSAYFVGKTVGRTPLAARLSPNKTVEGTVGSLAVTGLIFALLIMMPVLSPVQRAIFGLSLALAAAAGDLFESGLKRLAGAKDSGRLLPGHGGLLDRIDSLLFSGTVGYFLLSWWVG